MSTSKSTMVPKAREAMNQFKMEAASDLGAKTHIGKQNFHQ